METVLLIFGLAMFVLLIVLHELGHAIVARRNGVVVEEFGVGFPPRAWAKKLKNGVLFTLNWLPLGGFVKLKGEHDSAKGEGTYGGATLWVKTKILLAGVAVNWLAAAAIFTILALFGLPKILPNQFAIAADSQTNVTAIRVGDVIENSPAKTAGVELGDSIVSLNNQQVISAAQFAQMTAENAGQTVSLKYDHSGEVKEAQVELNKERVDGQGHIGIAASDQTTQRATWSAPLVGLGVTTQLTFEALKGLGSLVVNIFQADFSKAGEGVAGPVGIFTVLQSSSDLGIVPVMLLIGLISLSLAVMNALPIPALDGGRLFVTILFRVLKKPLTKEREEAIQAAGFISLMVLVLLVTVVDVGKLF